MASHLSRADLLKALSASASQEHLHQGIVEALGYEGQEQVTPPESFCSEEENKLSDHLNESDSSPRDEGVLSLPKREQRYWVVDRCQPKESVPLEAGDWPEIEPEETSASQPLPQHPLRTEGQWQNLWDSALSGRRKGRMVDLKRSLHLLQRNEPVHNLPRCERASFNRPVVIILEWSEALYPIWDDMRDAWRTLNRLLGKRALRGFFVADGPLSEWRCLHRRGLGNYGDISSGSQVILVGSFESTEHRGKMNQEWQQLAKQLDHDGHQVALITAHHLQHNVAECYALEPSVAALANQNASDALLSAIANHCLPDCQQLRHLRKAVPAASVVVELDVWQHHQTECLDGYLQIEESGLADWRKRWPELSTPALEEALQACRQSQDEVASDMSRLQHQLDHAPQASQFSALQRLGKAVAESHRKGEHYSHAQFAMRSLLVGIRALADSQPEAGWQHLMVEAQRVAMRRHEALPLNDQGLDEVAGNYMLFQHRQQLRLVTENEMVGLPLLEVNSLPFCKEVRGFLPTLSPKIHNSLEISDRSFNYQLKSIRCPAWAQRIWRNQDGLFAAHQDGVVLQLVEAGDGQPQSYWHLIDNPWPWADQVGVDDQGLWAEFVVRKKKLFSSDIDARHRLRWIRSGTFMMGSPEKEEWRSDDETQHQVTLTHGYWLGETSVTQALWQAVMGENPSRFKGEGLPVEKVSWHDCQHFIEQLNKMLPGFNPALPTEAQWEYACRAGTETAYWWGEEMDDKYVNNGNQTEHEANYSPNDFGLRSMSGNVYEWCNDWSGDYLAEPVTDPVGPAEGRKRVLRGGCWIDGGRILRSAIRGAAGPVFRNDGIGLRLAGGRDPQAGQRAQLMSADRLERSVGRRGTQGLGESEKDGAG